MINRVRNGWIYMNLGGGEVRQVEREHFLRDDTRAIERMIQPEIWRQRMVRRVSDDTIFKRITGLEPEDAHGFYADVLIGGKFLDSRIRGIRNCAGKNVCRAAARVSDVHEWNLHGLEAAVVIEVQPCELAHAKFAVDLYQRVHFFSRIAVCFETIFCLEQLNLCRVRRFCRLFLRNGGGAVATSVNNVSNGSFTATGTTGKSFTYVVYN